MRRYFVILLFILLVPKVWSQDDTHIVDSLLDVLPTQQGRDRVLTMMELTWEFCDISFDESTAWGEKAIVEAQAMDSTRLLAKANYVLGMQYCFHGDMDLAKEYLTESCTLYASLGDLSDLFDSQFQLARYEQSRGNIDSSLVFYGNALSTAQQMHDTLANSDVLFNMAVIRYQKGDVNQSKLDFLRLRDFYSQQNDEKYLAFINMNLAILEMELGDVVAARSLFKSVVPVFESDSDYEKLIVAYKNWGQLYISDIVNYDSALMCLNRARTYCGFWDDTEIETDVINELGDAYYQMENYVESLRYYNEALGKANVINYKSGMMAAYAGMGQVYCRMGQASKSLECFKDCFDLENEMGSNKYRSYLSGCLIMDYARLGRFDDMEAELGEIEEDRKALIRENADWFDENLRLQAETVDLCLANQVQSDQIDALATRAKHYQLVFFGLLGLVLIVIAYVIIKNLKR